MSNDPLTGIVFDIQHFSVSDGPGIRTVVFLKGCPLRCSWCHNPESYQFRPQVMAFQERCLHCGACTAACPEGMGGMGLLAEPQIACHGCGKCVSVCPAGALEMAGKTMTVQQVIWEVMEDMPFYRASQGGVTLSGGEPMAQFEFALALSKEAKEQGLHICLETSGHCSTEKMMAIRPYVDLFLYDYKLTGDDAHRQHTGVSQQLILENLRRLDESGAACILRCPMIPGVNIHPEHAAGIIRLSNSLQNVKQIHLEPYQKIGLSKRSRLGMDATDAIALPDKNLLKNMAEKIAEETGLETLVM